MPNIQLPDRSVRQFDNAVTGAEIADLAVDAEMPIKETRKT